MSGDTLFVRRKEGTEVVATVEWATREYAFLQAQESAGWPDDSADAVQVLAGYIVPLPVYRWRARDEEAGVPSLVNVVFEMVKLAKAPGNVVRWVACRECRYGEIGIRIGKV